MNIYIYGNQRFKKEIYKILDSSQIKKIDNNVIIKEISNLNDLKETIKAQPKDIYLIDDEKIIKKDSLKSKFFAPKDGVDEQFLVESGVNDLTINSLNEIPEYIIRKYELEKNLEDIKKENKVELDDELSKLLANETQIEKKAESTPEIKDDEIVSGVNLNELENLIETTEETENIDLHKLDNNDKIANEFEDFNNDFGLNNISFDYDDDNILNDNSLSDEDLLSQILNSSSMDEDNYEFLGETFEEVNFLEELFPEKAEFLATFEKPEKPEKQIENFENEIEDDFEHFDEDDEDVQIPKEENIQNLKEDEEDTLENERKEVIIEPIENEELDEEEKDEICENFEGEIMDENEFSELDSLNEKDLMEALNYNADEIVQVAKNEETSNIVSDKNKETVTLNSSNVDEISQLISKLLNNKTLEITIKLKD
ncbi:hypothetical protein N5U06_08950 [Aliarcobacter butzleri]|uniref:hypothetical protein n=1 Tax=Aliarcobacter butzleri TaxID=28197 RepID=UPI0021B16AC9|nr:hypothetical protein [Aliarcobacter butzleri]MCT7630858.1 hypothetical protein [Aliarcobacter butzleri]